VVLNPVRAGIVREAGAWQWSSYRATVGQVPTQNWLTTDTILSTFSRDKDKARDAYRCFVAEGEGRESVWSQLRGQIYLGDEQFVARMQRKLGDERDEVQIPKPQRRAPPPSLEQIRDQTESRNAAIVEAHATGAYSYVVIAKFFDLHFTTVGRIVRGAQNTGA